VEFSFKDHRDGKHKNLRLSMKEFMRRLLIHQLEMGTHTIRHYGLYGVQATAAYSTSTTRFVLVRAISKIRPEKKKSI
jgi:hypothetical protein